MASIGFLIGGAVIDALAFSGSVQFFIQRINRQGMKKT